LKLDRNVLRNIIEEVLLEGEGEEEKKKPPTPPEGGGKPPEGGDDGAIKLKIKIPDTPFEDDEEEKKVKKEQVNEMGAMAAANIGSAVGAAMSDEDEEKEEKVDELAPLAVAGIAAGASMLAGEDEEEDENVKEISESKLRKIIRNSIFENLKKRVDETTIKFDLNKVKSLIKKDKFLQQAFKVLSGDEKAKTNKIFNNFIVGDKKLEKIYIKEELNEFGTGVSIDMGANFDPHPNRKDKDSKNQGVFLQKFSSGEARSIIDGQLQNMVQDIRKVEGRVIKTWMQGAKSGAIDFFDIIRGLKTGDARRAHPEEIDFFVKLLTKDKIIDRFRSYFKGKKGKLRK